MTTTLVYTIQMTMRKCLKWKIVRFLKEFKRGNSGEKIKRNWWICGVLLRYRLMIVLNKVRRRKGKEEDRKAL
jgi:hypothetical protein